MCLSVFHGSLHGSLHAVRHGSLSHMCLGIPVAPCVWEFQLPHVSGNSSCPMCLGIPVAPWFAPPLLTDNRLYDPLTILYACVCCLFSCLPDDTFNRSSLQGAVFILPLGCETIDNVLCKYVFHKLEHRELYICSKWHYRPKTHAASVGACTVVLALSLRVGRRMRAQRFFASTCMYSLHIRMARVFMFRYGHAPEGRPWHQSHVCLSISFTFLGRATVRINASVDEESQWS